MATGGLSVPSTGSDGSGLRIAKALGHRVNPLYPALTPLVTDPPVHAALSGVSLPVRLRARRGRHVAETRGGFLFTHRGYSGPALLDLSHVTPIRYTMAEAVEAVRGHLDRLGQASFRDLVADCDERIQIVVRFLALLELYREGKVDLEQAETFGEIEVRWEGEAA